jgi:hypothetical protein
MERIHEVNVESGSGAMIYIPSFLKIGLEKGIHRHTDSKVFS